MDEVVRPTADDDLTALMRDFTARVRREAEKREERDIVDRILAAASLVIAAMLIAWPKDRKLPLPVAVVVNVGRQLWRRRNWWMP